jgi:hypothetical protein
MINKMRPLSTLLAALLVVGCVDGLVYGERTSFDLASVRVNDDPSEPVSVKLGFDRSVALAAPAIGGKVEEEMVVDGRTYRRITPEGEAVSQFSSFTMKSTAPFVRSLEDEPDALLGVQSRFATGQAAIEIAGKPEVVAAFLGLGVPSAEEQVADALSALDPAQQDRLCQLAARDFDDLSDLEKQEAGELTGFLSNYDAALHADLHRACEQRG